MMTYKNVEIAEVYRDLFKIACIFGDKILGGCGKPKCFLI